MCGVYVLIRLPAAQATCELHSWQAFLSDEENFVYLHGPHLLASAWYWEAYSYMFAVSCCKLTPCCYCYAAAVVSSDYYKKAVEYLRPKVA